MGAAESVGADRIGIAALARWAGIAVSAALVLGAGVWTWRLVEREALGVPAVQADPTPMRIAPTEPGGQTAAHQGLSVSRIAEGAGEPPLAAELRLAPGAAVLAHEDMPRAPEPAPPAIDATDLAVAEALGLDTAALVRASARPGPRPVPRPSLRSTAAAMPAAAPGSSAGEAVQLGAFPAEAAAADGWRALVDRFPDLLDGTERRIERVEQGSRVFWRLRAAGFDDLADARRVCAALAAGSAECIPVVRR